LDTQTPVKILLVDDRPENLLALEAILEGHGYQLMRANSGEEALKQVLRHDFAVILLDVQMPGMSGFETAEMIKRRDKSRHVPIIFLTAISKDDQYVFAGYAAGAVDYLFKPFNPDILRSKVAVFVELWQKRQQIQRQAELLREAEQREREHQVANLEAINERLRQVDQYKDEFLSVISHELRTPLNFIMGFASIVDDEVAGPLTPEQHDYMQRILYGSERMLRLVDDLLDFAKVSAGKLVLMPREVQFGPLVEDVMRTLTPLAAQKHITLEADVQVAEPACIDDQRIVQILTNLVNNGIKFTPEGGRVTVKARLDGGQVVTEVIDTGKGIDPDDLPNLFVRFKQLDMSATREAGGTGLGLSITKALVEAHGGTIQALSDGKGQGATFRFTLPLSSCTLETAGDASAPSDEAPTGQNAVTT
jgi:two-component system, sensor histidine kinase